MMRIKTFERVLPLKEVYEICENLIDSEYEISENSFYEQENCLISAINLEENSILISGIQNSEHKRTHLAIKIIPTKDLLDILSEKREVQKTVPAIGEALIEILKKEIETKTIFPFIKLDGKELAQKGGNNKLINQEKDLFNKITAEIKEKFNYEDDFINFPFSIAKVEGSWELWEPIYEPYLIEIEKNLDKIKNFPFNIYKNYEFSYPREFYQRIFDLVIREEIEAEKFDPGEIFTGVITKRVSKIAKIKKAKTKKKPKIKGTHFIRMTFV